MRLIINVLYVLPVFLDKIFGSAMLNVVYLRIVLIGRIYLSV